MANFFQPRNLTPRRIWLAFAVAMAADGLQLLSGPAGWVPFDQIVDVLAMAIVTWLLGFHFLFLPTFLLEFFPLVDMIPTWTGCVAAVVALRRKTAADQAAPPVIPPSPSATSPKPRSDVIDI